MRSRPLPILKPNTLQARQPLREVSCTLPPRIAPRLHAIRLVEFWKLDTQPQPPKPAERRERGHELVPGVDGLAIVVPAELDLEHLEVGEELADLVTQLRVRLVLDHNAQKLERGVGQRRTRGRRGRHYRRGRTR